MDRRYVGEGDAGVVNFIGFSVGQRFAMAWSLFFNCRVVLPWHFEVHTSLVAPEPVLAPPREPPAT